MQIKKIIAREGLILLVIIAFSFLYTLLSHNGIVPPVHFPKPIHITYEFHPVAKVEVPTSLIIIEDTIERFFLFYPSYLSICFIARFMIWAIKTLKQKSV